MPRRPAAVPPAAEFGEKDFYLDEFRGRSVLIALAATDTASLGGPAAVVADLIRNGTRVLVWWPATSSGAERRLLAALRRAGALARPRPGQHPPLVRMEPGPPEPVSLERVRTALWSCSRRTRLCVVSVRDDGTGFPGHPAGLAAALRIPKLVLVDPRGGLGPGAGRMSFVDENVLETLLHQGEAEWTGLGDRRAVLVAVRTALEGGVEAVNLCTPDGIAEELFTYVGSGTLFTRGDYCRVAPLGLDDFAQAERLLERGQREGMLKHRSPDEVAQVLACGFGASIAGRHLAGVVGLLTGPYAAERAGEIVGLYTITRFKGEGLGDRLVARVLAEAEARGLSYVFASATHERAQHFFARIGFERVTPDDVPAAKWVGYDPRRRARVGVFRRALPAVAAAARA